MRRHEAAVVTVCAVLAALPVLLCRYFPGLDVPWHAAIIEVLHQHDAARVGREFLGYFELKQQVPSYLAFYYLVDGLAFVTGDVITAVSGVIALYVVGFVVATRVLLRAYGGDGLYALAAIPAAYSVTLEFGFVTYALTFPLTLLFWASTRRLMAHGIRWGRVVAVVLLAFAIAFTHPFAAAAAIAGGVVLAAVHLGAVSQAGRRFATWAGAVAVAMVPAVASVVAISADPDTAIGARDQYGGLLTQLLEMDRTPLVDSIAIVPVWLFGFVRTPWSYGLFAALLCGVVIGRHVAHRRLNDPGERGPLFALLALATAYLLTPFVFAWPREWFAAQPRLVPLLFVLVVVVLRARPTQTISRGHLLVALAAFTGLAAMTAQTFWPHRLEGRDFEAVIRAGARHAKTLALIEMPRTELHRPASPWRHAGAWLFVENHGLVSGLPMVRTGATGAGDLIPVGLSRQAPALPSGPPLGYARTFRWETDSAGWEQILIRDTDPDQPFDYLRENAESAELVARAGRWRLFVILPRRDAAASPGSP